jgi:hypothetical protein
LKTGSKEITSVRQRRWHNWPETKVKQASKLTDRHPWMGILKCWLHQPSILRWWNYNQRPKTGE